MSHLYQQIPILQTIITRLAPPFSVIRDLAQHQEANDECQKCIYQRANTYQDIPERSRIIFTIREEAQKFIDVVVREPKSTLNDELLAEYKKPDKDISVQNMAMAISHIRKFFADNADIKPEFLLKFLLNKVLLIYVSTANFDDAFRLFTILNDRGVPLRNSDILKSKNLGALSTDKEKKEYAKLWEDAESELGEEFDRFLHYIRTILVKEKARLSLLQEFEDKIYEPKSTGSQKSPLLGKGKETFQMLEKYLKGYRQLFEQGNYDLTNDFKFDNLLKLMRKGLPSSDWIPPLLRYHEKFGTVRIYDFLRDLDNKFSTDWIRQETPTTRIEAMNSVIKLIDKSDKPNEVFVSECLDVDVGDLQRILGGKIYGKHFARYVLLKLDYMFHDQKQKMHFEALSVEHILPQNPKADSQWLKDFTEEEKADLTDKLGNLVLITRNKNSSQGRLDYSEKKQKYFSSNISTCPNSLRVLQNVQWTPNELNNNQTVTLSCLMEYYAGGAKRVMIV